MAIYRTVNSDTWDDPWFAELEPDAKLLFLYLITNRRSTPCGVFEITTRAVAFETGLQETRVKDILPALEPKIVWWGNIQTIWVRNFYKHQRANSNDKFAIAAAKSLHDAPPVVQRTLFSAYPELEEAFVILYPATPLPPLPHPPGGGDSKEKKENKKSKERVEEGGAQDAPDTPPAKQPILKATRIPDDFAMTDDMLEWAQKKGYDAILSLKEETDEFITYWSEGEGTGERRKNWRLVWQTRMQERFERLQALQKRGVKSNGNQTESRFAQAARNYDELSRIMGAESDLLDTGFLLGPGSSSP